jgi:regulator of sigma E protease
MGYIVSLLVLSGLIFFHELGHYTAAKLVGVYVEVFSIGFGKRLLTFRAFNTEWSISAIPLGGYVRMKGQDDADPAKKNYDKDSYNSKSPLQRIFILVAGPLANFILAFFLYFTIAMGNPAVLAPVVGSVVKESPAAIAGLESNDTILSINGHKIQSWKEMADLITASEGAIALEVNREGYLKLLTLTPKLQDAKNMYGEKIKRKMIGIAAAGVMKKRELTFMQKIKYATDQTVFASTMIFTGLEKLLVGDVPASEMGGVISIVKLTSDATDAGWMSVLFFAALISVNLGVLNLLPIPALDGGHIMFNLYELIFRREANEKIVIKLTIAGWIILFGLMGLGLFNDINRLIG